MLKNKVDVKKYSIDDHIAYLTSVVSLNVPPMYSKRLLCLYLLMYGHSLFLVNVLSSHEPSAARVAELNTGNILDIGWPVITVKYVY